MDGSAGGSNEEELSEERLNSPNDEVKEVLSSFRSLWQEELRNARTGTKNEPQEQSKNKETEQEDEDEADEEKQAKAFYMKGAEMERLGKFYDAILWYKRAMQLVPDIDYKVQQKYLATIRREENVEHHSEIENHTTKISEDEDSDDENLPLLARIQKKMVLCEYVCETEYPKRQTHISELPMEILLYILKWVVSSELDLRSLETCSLVSRGFYLCARDAEIWKLACLRAWGINCGNFTNYNYQSWRDMFINRNKLQFHGCYISKTTYIRHGEKNFQDQFNRPWHLVTYYRYLRFFSDGLVFMLTTPDEPSQCVGLLKNRQARIQTVLAGHYRLKDDKVTIVVQHQDTGKPANPYKRGRRRNDVQYESGEQSFHLELKIKSVKKYRHFQLDWSHYSIFTKHKDGAETECAFEITSGRFPPLWFSRVKSYTQESLNPLL